MRWMLGSRFWTILGGIVAIAALLISSYQFAESVRLSKRIMLGELAMEAHRQTYAFIAEFTQHYSADRERFCEGCAMSENVIAPEIRISTIIAEGAIARAQIIEQYDIQSCLMRMYQINSELAEISAPQNHDVDLQGYALDLDAFPILVRHYIDNTTLPNDMSAKPKANGEPSCKIIEFDPSVWAKRDLTSED